MTKTGLEPGTCSGYQMQHNEWKRQPKGTGLIPLGGLFLRVEVEGVRGAYGNSTAPLSSPLPATAPMHSYMYI